MTISGSARAWVVGVMLVAIGQGADAQVCRGRNASGGMRIGAEQLLADGEDAGKAFLIGLAKPRGPVFEMGVAGAAGGGLDALYGILGFELRGKTSNFSVCPYYAALYNDLAETLTHAVGLQAGYAIPFSKTVSFTPAAAYFVNFDGTNDPVPMYWAGGSLNLDRFSIYAALENAVDSDADPKLRLGVSLNVGGARR